jgi:hypothetical protein
MKILALPFLLVCCTYAAIKTENSPKTETVKELDVVGNSLSTRFSTPDSFTRYSMDSGTFAYYLQHLTLKPAGELVKYYHGGTKPSGDVYCGVVDMEISAKDLQQCADAVMRLRGEYLFGQNKLDQISFRFTGDGKMHGFKEYANKNYSYANFRKYMDYVFGYANTASLKKQLKPVPFYTMQIGDVLIQSGNPYGHAVIVIDMCKNAKGDRRYMLAQSYMPAQETQVLLSPDGESPWYIWPERSVISTPEWTFDTSDLRRW